MYNLDHVRFVVCISIAVPPSIRTHPYFIRNFARKYGIRRKRSNIWMHFSHVVKIADSECVPHVPARVEV